MRLNILLHELELLLAGSTILIAETGIKMQRIKVNVSLIWELKPSLQQTFACPTILARAQPARADKEWLTLKGQQHVGGKTSQEGQP
jgi:hypothetical protein